MSSVKADSSAHRIAIYPGTFDPITFGHIDVIGRASDLFDEVIVALAKNSQKSPLLSDEERYHLVQRSIEECFPTKQNIKVDAFDGLLVNYAESKGAIAILRGIRVLSDFDYEFRMALMNRKLKEEISTVFLMPHEKYTYLHSSLVRELARYGESVESFVPKAVAEAIKAKFAK
ncbi:MAG TPA: pantetheine-phosphate adenylyltransferase [Candidatus Kapabacteria bacterium]|nr:pantetheine-phosphate adenylyltransferase [Candidatus Kapabacteria bacterium]